MEIAQREGLSTELDDPACGDNEVYACLLTYMWNFIVNFKAENNIVFLHDVHEIIKDIKESSESIAISLLYYIYEFTATRFSFYFFDEFQDTSRSQFEALKPLIDEVYSTGGQNGKVVIVGDPKQSIYQWRDADLKVILEVLDQYACSDSTITGNVSTLQYNYRSCRDIVEFNNVLFSNVICTRIKEILTMQLSNLNPDLLRELLKYYRKGLQYVPPQNQSGSSRMDNSKHVRIFPVSGKGNKGDRKKRVFKHMTEEIKKLISNDRNKTGYGNITVLFRKGKDANEFVRFLAEEGIPVISSKGLKLLDREDGIFWISMLKAWYYGWRYANSRIKDFEWNKKLYLTKAAIALIRAIPNLNIEGRFGILSVLERVINEVSASSNGNYYGDITGIFLRIVRGVQKHVSGVLNKPEFGESAIALVHFLERTRGEEEVVRLFEGQEIDRAQMVRPLDNEGGAIEAVKVRTVHDAKGLEDDVVFIPFLAWDDPVDPLGSGNGNNIILLDRNGKVPRLRIVAKQHVEEKLSAKEKNLKDDDILALKYYEKALGETINVLYVAFTRPRDKLFVWIRKEYGKKEYSKVKLHVSNWIAEAEKDTRIENAQVKDGAGVNDSLRRVMGRADSGICVRLGESIAFSCSDENSSGCTKFAGIYGIHKEDVLVGEYLHGLLAKLIRERKLNIDQGICPHGWDYNEEIGALLRSAIERFRELIEKEFGRNTLDGLLIETEYQIFDRGRLHYIDCIVQDSSGKKVVIIDFKFPKGKDRLEEWKEQITQYCNLYRSHAGLRDCDVRGYLIVVYRSSKKTDLIKIN